MRLIYSSIFTLGFTSFLAACANDRGDTFNHVSSDGVSNHDAGTQENSYFLLDAGVLPSDVNIWVDSSANGSNALDSGTLDSEISPDAQLLDASVKIDASTSTTLEGSIFTKVHEIDDQIRRAGNDAKVYSEIEYQIRAGKNKIRELVYSKCSPKTALVKLEDFLLILDDLDNSLHQLYVTENMRGHIFNLIAGGYYFYTVCKRSIEQMNFENMWKERIFITEIITHRDTLDKKCKALVNDVARFKTDIRSEEAFLIFLAKCKDPSIIM